MTWYVTDIFAKGLSENLKQIIYSPSKQILEQFEWRFDCPNYDDLPWGYMGPNPLNVVDGAIL